MNESSSVRHYARTFGCEKVESPGVCFTDYALGPDGTGRLKKKTKDSHPPSSRMYKRVDFALVGPTESGAEKEAASKSLESYFGSTWCKNWGAHTAVMSCLLLALGGHSPGRYVVFAEKSDTGKTMADALLAYFLGGDLGSGEGPLTGPLHGAWLTSEERWRAEAHGVGDCVLTFTQELSTLPLDNALLERACCDVTQRMRRPHAQHTFSMCFGRALHLIEANHVPRLSFSTDDPKAMEKIFIAMSLGNSRSFTKDASKVDTDAGVFLQRPERDLNTELLCPAVRRACYRYLDELSKDWPLGKCASVMLDLSLLDTELGSALVQDTRSFVEAMFKATTDAELGQDGKILFDQGLQGGVPGSQVTFL